MLHLIDEYARVVLVMPIDRRLRFANIIDLLSDERIHRGVPDHIKSDNGLELVALRCAS